MTNGLEITTTDYAGNYIYQNNILQMISQPEGYIETNNKGGFDYVYQYKDHLGNVRLTYKDDQLYDTDFNNGIVSPWTPSENTTSMTIEGDRLKVITAVHLNGANGYYNLLAGETYEIAIDIDRSLFTTDLEFSLWNGNSKIYGEYVTTSKTLKMNYTPTISATYRINLRLRDYGYTGDPQTFYLDNVIIRKTALAIIEENNYYPFGLKHQGYNFVVSSNVNAIAGKFKYNSKELNDELGLNLYDYGARMYDPELGRWQVIDEKAEKYSYASPYNYALNNPVKFVDIDGRDVVILVAKDGAGGMGHMGAIIQDGNGNWYYMTQGAADPNGNMSNMISGGIQGGMNLVPLGTKDKNEAIAIAKQDQNNSKYTDQVELKTTSKMDANIFKSAKKQQEKTNSGEKKYNLLTNNCVDAVQDPVEEGTGVKLPLDIDPRPNKYFEKLQKNQKKVQRKIDEEIQRQKKIEEKKKEREKDPVEGGFF